MNVTRQGVQRRSKIIRLLIHFLLLSNLYSIQTIAEENITATLSEKEINASKPHVYVIHSPDSALHTSINKKLTESLKLKHPEIILSTITRENKSVIIDDTNDIIVSIGLKNMLDAKENYPNTTKLFISTDPEKFKLDTDTEKNDAILYMAQPYCRQMEFIKSLNNNWKIISLLISQDKPVDINKIQRCANRYDLTIYPVTTANTENISDELKKALTHSDALLALPDNSIYNSNTVKNILLTSYRYRKPVIAFSRSFVNAGALASVNSSVEQVAVSASVLIEQYYERGNHFKNPVNHPQTFEIHINRQVFKALDLPIPDIDKLMQSLKSTDEYITGMQR